MVKTLASQAKNGGSIPLARSAPWQGRWLNPPPHAAEAGGALVVDAARGSDLWRDTSYGFRHENAHALLRPFPAGSAVEVAFMADYDGTFDQAGALLWVDPTCWLKAGVEISDGVAQLGAVATRGLSDWSMAPVPEWAGREVTVRLSRTGDAVTVRARADADPWRMVRLAPVAPAAQAEAGPYCCAPEREGLQVRFTAWREGPADRSLHRRRLSPNGRDPSRPARAGSPRYRRGGPPPPRPGGRTGGRAG